MGRIKLQEKQCKKIAEVVNGLTFNKTHFNRPYLDITGNKEEKLRTYLFSVAICHQTQNLFSKKYQLAGWDYIEKVFANLAKDKSTLLDLEYLDKSKPKEIEIELRKSFSDSNKQEDSTLETALERGEILSKTARAILKNYQGKVSNLISLSDNRLINSGHGLYEILEEIPVFVDPLRKKSTAFIKFIEEAGIMKIKDPDNFTPIVDYHMQRVLLRTGCLEVLDKGLQKILKEKTPMKSDKELRSCAVTAMREISSQSKKTIPEIDDIFWSLGRSCCHEKTLCYNGSCNKSPCTFATVIAVPDHKECVFSGICPGNHNERYREYWEPVVDTNFY
ncbi:queuosine salvage family protein [Patescibacteria group bacterium]|nr:queuosine salvage family protein [Patescibacteria group bacterium]